MAILLGGSLISTAMVGSSPVDKVMLGSSLVWSSNGFYPYAVVITSAGTGSYTIPAGASYLKAWAIGSGSTTATGEHGAGGTCYMTRAVSGGSVSYKVGTPSISSSTVQTTGDSTVTYASETITGKQCNSVGPYIFLPGSFSGGDGGANGGSWDYDWIGGDGTYGGAVGGNGRRLSCGITPMTDVSGLMAALTLAGVSYSPVNLGASSGTPAFGSGGVSRKYTGGIPPGIGGGLANLYSSAATRNGTGGAVVLYFF